MACKAWHCCKNWLQKRIKLAHFTTVCMSPAGPGIVAPSAGAGGLQLELHPMQQEQKHYDGCSRATSGTASLCIAAHTAAVYVHRIA